jgi:carboxyl-terminal processing protease
MRISALFILSGLLLQGGCTGDARPVSPPPVSADACSIDGQKQFVLDRMREVYFWNDLLPGSVDIGAYPTPEALLEYLTSFQPLDNFSYIDLAASDAQFFGEGRYEGFGFSTRFESADDLRFSRVFASSPANAAGFVRGQRIIALNGRSIADIEANEGVGAVFSLPSVEFTIRRPDDSEFTTTVDKGIVTTFISTADAEFAAAFDLFRQANVSDLIIDLRYNGGGLVVTTELLGDYLGGGVPSDTIFSHTLFNEDNAFFNRIEFFETVAGSLNLSRMVVIATAGTASASELVTNAMIPHADVSIVGANTLGKPVGQLGLEFCDKILRPTAFETINSNGDGRYFDGLPADCPAADDLAMPIGADGDPNMIAALSLLDTGACPVRAAPAKGLQKPPAPRPASPRQATPWGQYADAW